MAELTDQDVERIAALSRLALPAGEASRVREALSAVLGYVERMRGPDLEGVEPLVHVGGGVNRLGADEPGAVLETSVLLGMAPERMGSFVRVPKVIDEGTLA